MVAILKQVRSVVVIIIEALFNEGYNIKIYMYNKLQS